VDESRRGGLEGGLMDGVEGWSTVTGMGGEEWSHESIESFGFFPPLSKRNVINVIETWSERFRT
jgi:hypothetical protein